ncbi:MAG TPA: FUSC family protein [Gemmatimonadales bacterium]
MAHHTTVKLTLRELRAAAALAPARPAYAAGMRGALAVVVPLAVAMLLGLPNGLWMSMAALNGVLADRGGAYRARAVTLAVMTCASAALAAVATLAGGELALVAPLAFVVAAGSGMARALGASGTGAGLQVLITFLVALALPSVDTRASDAIERAALILLGGGWAMLLTLGLWPLRPYQPVRRAVALCYRELAVYVAEIGRRLAAGEPLAADRLAGHAATVRRAVEQAREKLGSTRRGGPGETARGARLLELHEIADRWFVHADAIADTIEAVGPTHREAAARDALTAHLADVASTLRALADATVAERSEDAVSVTWSGATLRATDGASGTGFGGVHFAHAGVLLDRMARLGAAAAAAAAALESGERMSEGERASRHVPLAREPGALARVRAALAPGSLVLRFSLQLGLVTTAALALAALLDLPYGHWITITAAIVLQPYTGATTQRAVQRILGTILGGAVAAGLSALFHDPVALVGLIGVFAALSIALLPLNFAVFSVFITPAFVLLVEVGVGEWGLAGVRVLNTVLGAALALAAARLLWPEPERRRFPSHVASALRACREYLRVVTGVLTEDPGTGGEQSMREARRRIGLAAINAEESFQRLLGEHRGPAARLEPAMAVLDYIRHLANSIATLALARHSAEPGRREEVRIVAEAAGAVLEELEAALIERRPPAALPVRPVAGDSHAASLLGDRLDRLVQHTEALHDAVTRWIAAAEAGIRTLAASRPDLHEPPGPQRPVTGTSTPRVLR